MSAPLLALLLALVGGPVLPPRSIVPDDNQRAAVYYEQLADALAAWRADEAAYLNYRKAAEQDPTRLSARLGLARMLARLGREPLAVQQVQLVLSVEPEHQEANRVLAKLMLVGGRPLEAEQVLLKVVRRHRKDAEAQRLLGTSLLMQQRFVDAEAEVRRAVRLDDDEPEGYRLLWQTLVAQKRPVEAIAPVEKLVALNPDDVPALATLAELYIGTKQLEKALKVGEKLVEKVPDEPRFLLGTAEVLVGLKRPDQAAGYFRKLYALAKEPALVGRTAGWLAGYHQSKGQFGQAAGYVRRLIQLRPELLPPRHELVRLYMMAGNWSAAAGATRSLVALQPDNPALRFQLVRFYLMADQPRSARHAARAVAARWGGETPLIRTLAGLFHRAHQPDAAAELLRGLLARHPDDVSTRMALYQLYASLGRTRDARALLDRWHRDRPDDPFARHLLAEAAFEAGKHERVVELLAPLAPKGMLEPTALGQLAQSLERVGRPADALGAYQLLARSTKQPRYLVHAARMAERINNWPLVAELFSELLEKQPHSVPALVGRGRALANLGELQRALDMFELALEHDRDHPLALASAALALHGLGRREESQVFYARLAKVDPSNPFAYALQGDIAAERRHLDAAIRVWQEGLETLPDSAPLHRRLAEAMAKLGDIDAAAAHYEAAAHADVSDHMSQWKAARLASAQGAFSQARYLWSELIDRRPSAQFAYRGWLDTFALGGTPALGVDSGLQRLADMPANPALVDPLVAYAARTDELERLTSQVGGLLESREHSLSLRDAYGMALAEGGRRGDALDWFAAQSAREPLQSRWPRRQGALLEYGGQLSAAAEAYAEAARIDPGDVPAQVSLARTQLADGRVRDALQSLRAIVDAGRDHEIVLAGLVRRFEAAGELPAVRAYLAALLTADDGSGADPRYARRPDVQALHGLALELAGARAEADRAYRQALALNPGSATATAGLQRLEAARARLSRPLAGPAAPDTAVAPSTAQDS